MSNDLKFAPFHSFFDILFWKELARLKLEEYKLDDDFKDITGFYNEGSDVRIPPLFKIEKESLSSCQSNGLSKNVKCRGKIKVFNTFQAFRNFQYENFAAAEAEKMLHRLDQPCIDSIADLMTFYIFVYIDLKHYLFYYWCFFPAMQFPTPPKVENLNSSITDVLNEEQLAKLESSFKSYFGSNVVSIFGIDLKSYKIIAFKEAFAIFSSDSAENTIMFGIIDPCAHDKYPGWTIRHLFCFLAYKRPEKTASVLAVRKSSHFTTLRNSKVFVVKLDFFRQPYKTFQVIGFELNENNYCSYRTINLKNFLDSKVLMQTSNALNLQLMKWRMAPDLRLSPLSELRCLILGAGTLGCNVARNLMAWGVTHMTFVDNSCVSLSSPVRQSLFTFSDYSDGRTPKCAAAVANLRLINPALKLESFDFTIPMPGHRISKTELKSVIENIKTLERLIDSHDAIFLLTDTRESRWLPTLLGAAKLKLVLTAALGFDTFLVMRHGAFDATSPNEKLGCYFCSDIVVPTDSTKNRSMDQQCTISRPGLSCIASSLLCELVVNLLQRPERQFYNADNMGNPESTCIGSVPHTIRGFLSNWQIVTPVVKAFSHCCACSEMVVNTYKNNGIDALIGMLNDPSVIETHTELNKFLQKSRVEAEHIEESDDNGYIMFR